MSGRRVEWRKALHARGERNHRARRARKGNHPGVQPAADTRGRRRVAPIITAARSRPGLRGQMRSKSNGVTSGRPSTCCTSTPHLVRSVSIVRRASSAFFETTHQAGRQADRGEVNCDACSRSLRCMRSRR